MQSLQAGRTGGEGSSELEPMSSDGDEQENIPRQAGGVPPFCVAASELPGRAGASAERQTAKVGFGNGEVRIQLVSQAARHAPAQLVPLEVQRFQAGEAAQLWRYLPAQPVPTEVQRFQAGEAAQLVPTEAQFSDTAVGVGGDTEPFAKLRFAQPVCIVIPVRAVRGIVERHQSSPVPAGCGGGSRCGGRRCRYRCRRW